MPAGVIRDPFEYDEANWRAETNSRLDQLERQPSLLAPIVQFARPITDLSVVAPFAFQAVGPDVGGIATTPLWESVWVQATHRGMFLKQKYQSTAPCRFRITAFDVTSGVTYTLNIPNALRTLPSTGGVPLDFTIRWFHGLPLWSGAVTLTTYGSRTSGAAFFGPPTSGFVQIDGRGCTVTG